MKYILILFFISLIGCHGNDETPHQNPFSINPSYLEVPIKGGKYEFTISSSSQWQVKNDTWWCDVTPESGSIRQNKITVFISSNQDETYRQCSIQVITESESKTITILQQGPLLHGQGTESNPYLIYTPQELSALADSALLNATSDKFYRLACDIIYRDSTCRIIGDENAPFYGSFDGNGHQISNFYLYNSTRRYVGLFGYVDSCANIKNVHLQGYIRGGDFTGSIAGYSRCNITNCQYEGQVIGNDYVGGIVGHNDSLIINCSHFGYIKGLSYVGGITGNNVYSISQCIAHDTIYGKQYCGGICAQNFNEVSHCSHNGDIYCTSSSGGVVGNNMGSLNNCYHSGSISTDCSQPDYTAGVCGQNSGSMIDCHNEGSVNAYWASGICSYNEGTVDGCYNIGNITGYQVCSGVCGLNKSNALILNCYNIGNVVAEENFCGGVCGQNSKNGIIANCYNRGNVTTKGYRIGGLAGINSGQIQNCYNSGTVTTSDTYRGSLYGSNSESGVIRNCYYLDTSATLDDPDNQGLVELCFAFYSNNKLSNGTSLSDILNSIASTNDRYCLWNNQASLILNAE